MNAISDGDYNDHPCRRSLADLEKLVTKAQK